MFKLDLQTPFCDRLRIGLPIMQAPIGGPSTPLLVAAVSNAGGLGCLSGTWRTSAELRDSIHRIREKTDRPFALNFVLRFPLEDKLAICIEERVPAVSLSWGSSAPYVGELHAAGIKVLETVASAEETKRAVAAGVDAIVAQGLEAGGHVQGEVTSIALIPAVVDAAGAVPVVAAGGIADGRGFLAALALGASGVCLGTRFVATVESAAHADYKRELLAARENDTIYTRLFDGGWPDGPHRVLRNSTVRRWESEGWPAPGTRPGEGETLGTQADGYVVMRYDSSPPVEGFSGDPEPLALYAGQSVGLVSEMKTAAQAVFDLAREAEEAYGRLAIGSGRSV